MEENIPATHNVLTKSTWNKQDGLTLRALRIWAGLTPEDCDTYVEAWSHGVWKSHKSITQDNIKAFTRYFRSKIEEQYGSEGLDDFIAAFLAEAESK